ncbi:hypothetical protein IAR50_001648 [Cryptococcus sp. DSM 104548]
MSFLPPAIRSLPPRHLARAQQPLCRCLSTTPVLSSGSNRWSKIRHKKGVVDQQRGALFSKLSKEIILAMRPPASPDPAFNSKLTTALQRAKEQGLPKQSIENALGRAKVVAEGGGQTVVYEALAAGGQVALLIECNTQNASRLVKRVKELLTKNGAQTSAVSFLFEKKGSITLTPNEGEGGEAGFEALFDTAVEAGAEDVREGESDDGGVEYEVITTPSTLSPITQLLQTKPAYTVQASELIFVANEPLKVLEEGQEGEGVKVDMVESVGKLVDVLEEETEVEKVWTNLE